MKNINIALAQINPCMGDFEGNREKIVSMLEQARGRGVDLVVFPEMVLCGYPPEDLLHRAGFLAANQKSLEYITLATKEMTAILGYAYSDGKGTYNSAAILHNGAFAGRYDKIELPNYGVFDEKRYFTPGRSVKLFVYDSLRIGITICEDIWVDGSTVEKMLSEADVDLVLNLSASPFHAGKNNERYSRLALLAGKAQAPVVYVNLVGGQDELVFDGGSMAVSPSGDIICSGKRFEEQLLCLALDIEPKASENKASDANIPTCRRFGNGSLPGGAIEPELDEVAEIYSALVLGTRDYVSKNNFTKVILGLSGGIDSALTAAIAVDALGNENVLGVTMPSEYSSEETRNDAKTLAENLGIRFHTLPIKPVLEQYQHSLSAVLGTAELGLTNENLQARIRGNLLMAFSNYFGYLVLTTGNKSETAVGYCTLYGDMAGGFAVIKDVPKTRVYQLAEFVNTKANRDIIPRTTITRAPTAELRPNQKDEDSLPPYAILDEVIKAFVEEDRDPKSIAESGLGKQVVSDTIRLVDKSEYKRRQAPPGVKITPKAFGRDRRIPLTHRFKQWL